MTKIKTDFLKDYWQATNDVAYKFIEKYFGKEEAEDFINENPLGYNDWIDFATRQTIDINGYYFGLDFMIECLMWSVKKNDMFDYYDYALDLAMKNSALEEGEKKETIRNLKHWLAHDKGYRGII